MTFDKLCTWGKWDVDMAGHLQTEVYSWFTFGSRFGSVYGRIKVFLHLANCFTQCSAEEQST